MRRDLVRVEFYSSPPESLLYRWRTIGRNGEIGVSGEAHTRQSDAMRAALHQLGVHYRDDIRVQDERHRARLARMLHARHPETSVEAWADQLNPAREGDR
jgi:hypothetical protein